MRPFLWGTIWFSIGLFGWVAFSVMYGILAGLGSKIPTTGYFLIDLFGIIFFFSLPMDLVAEVARWRRRKIKSEQNRQPQADYPLPPSFSSKARDLPGKPQVVSSFRIMRSS